VAETQTQSARKPKSGNGEGRKTPRPRRSAASKANEALARSYFAAAAARDPQAMAGHWSEDGVEDIVPTGVLRGPAAIAGYFSELFAALPDSEMIVERVVSDAETAVVQWRLSGTFDGRPFQGIAPTGRRVELRGADVIDIEDGKLVRNTAFFDGARFAREIGMLPPEDSGAERAMKTAFNALTKVRRAVAERK
jgi:steroid delta-isomerase-like uncharacterized protein